MPMAKIFSAAALRYHVPAWQEAFPQKLADIVHFLVCNPLVHSMMCSMHKASQNNPGMGVLQHHSRLVQPGSNNPEIACDKVHHWLWMFPEYRACLISADNNSADTQLQARLQVGTKLLCTPPPCNTADGRLG